MKRIIRRTTILLAFGLIACNSQNKPNSETEKQDLPVEKNINDMNSFISLFEIPATDISRAVSFYQAILEVTIEKWKCQEWKWEYFHMKDKWLQEL